MGLEEKNAKNVREESIEPIKQDSVVNVQLEESEKEIIYDINRPWLTLDDWQKEYIECKGNTFLLCGRQSGKSTAASIKFGRKAAQNPKSVILMIAYTEKQARNLFTKTLNYCKERHPQQLILKNNKRMGQKAPTQHEMHFRNGSVILCYAAGLTGLGLVGYTLTDLVVDEAALMGRQVFDVLTPTLSVTGGSLHLLSTPKGKSGFFYECSDDESLGEAIRDDFKRFYISAEDCPRHTKEFLEIERKTKSALIYAQEYEAKFLDDLMKLFPEELLKELFCQSSPAIRNKAKRAYLGIDVGGLGDDPSTFDGFQQVNKNKWEQIVCEETVKTYTTMTVKKVLDLQENFKFKKIGIDNGGLGVAVFHPLLKESKTRSRMIPLNNASKDLDDDGKKKATLLKEDMYFNALSMMENKEVTFIKDKKLFHSLLNIQYEKVEEEGKRTRYKIYGKDTHHAEAVIRALHLIRQDKSLMLWAR